MFQNILQYRGVRLQNAVARWLGGRSGNIVPKPVVVGDFLIFSDSLSSRKRIHYEIFNILKRYISIHD